MKKLLAFIKHRVRLAFEGGRRGLKIFKIKFKF